MKRICNQTLCECPTKKTGYFKQQLKQIQASRTTCKCNLLMENKQNKTKATALLKHVLKATTLLKHCMYKKPFYTYNADEQLLVTSTFVDVALIFLLSFYQPAQYNIIYKMDDSQILKNIIILLKA